MNFSTALYVLNVAAEKLGDIPIVKTVLKRLEEKMNTALACLSQSASAMLFQDANGKSNSGANFSDEASYDSQISGAIGASFVSSSTIAACEVVCDAIGDVECVLARASSLLHKFPGQRALVEIILSKGDTGEAVEVDDPEGRAGILAVIARQQQKGRSGASPKASPLDDATKMPSPCIREYVLKNRGDATYPCQLSVRMGASVDGGGSSDDPITANGGLILALSKCESEEL